MQIEIKMQRTPQQQQPPTPSPVAEWVCETMCGASTRLNSTQLDSALNLLLYEYFEKSLAP